ncbi:MAG: hypothetical protein HY246_01880 [Proteobacteria bacterium]|nr:hypothetical protein [Pseudomonadota bacterium]
MSSDPSESSNPSPSGEESAKDFFTNYAEYNRALRAWFVTFGLGGPALFLVKPELVAPLKSTGNLRFVVLAFICGCTFQIGIALINKICAWYEYDSKRKSKPFRGFWRSVSDWFWLDILCDIGTVVLFATAIWIMLDTFVV